MKRHKYPYEAQQEINDLERKLQEIKKVCENFDGSTVYLTSILPQIEKILNESEKGDE